MKLNKEPVKLPLKKHTNKSTAKQDEDGKDWFIIIAPLLEPQDFCYPFIVLFPC